MKRPLLFFTALLIVGALTVLEWRPWHTLQSGQDQSQTVSSTAEAAPPQAIETPVTKPAMTVPPETVQKDITTIDPTVIRAQLSPLNFTTITAELGAKVDLLPFREGESFTKGQTLVGFDCAAQSAQLMKYKALMAIAQRNAETARRLLELGAASRLEAENSASEYQRAKAEVNELTAIVSKCTIIAPFNGRVVEQKIRSEQFAQSGQSLLEILDNSALELEFVAPSKWASWLKVGYPFDIRIDETGRSYPAKITRVAARIDSVSQTLKVAAVVNGNYEELSPGMSGSIEIASPKAVQ